LSAIWIRLGEIEIGRENKMSEKKFRKVVCPKCDGKKCQECNFTGVVFTDGRGNLSKPFVQFTITTVGELKDAIQKFETSSSKDFEDLPNQMVKDGTASIIELSDDIKEDTIDDIIKKVKSKLEKNKKYMKCKKCDCLFDFSDTVYWKEGFYICKECKKKLDKEFDV